jgi:hypothetical protein
MEEQHPAKHAIDLRALSPPSNGLRKFFLETAPD